MTEPVAIPTSARRVVFFEDRAEVTRTARVSLTEGRQWVRLTGPTALLDDRTVQARVAGDRVKVLSARVIRRTRSVAVMEYSEAQKIYAAYQATERDVQAIQTERQRLQRRSSYLQQVMQHWCTTLAQVPKPGEDSPPSEWAAAWQKIIQRDDEYLAQDNGILDRLDEATERHRVATQRANESGGTRTVYECFIEVQLDSSTMDDIEVEVKYRTKLDDVKAREKDGLLDRLVRQARRFSEVVVIMLVAEPPEGVVRTDDLFGCARCFVLTTQRDLTSASPIETSSLAVVCKNREWRDYSSFDNSITALWNDAMSLKEVFVMLDDKLSHEKISERASCVYDAVNALSCVGGRAGQRPARAVSNAP